jgi:hypothetical protein
VLVIGKKNYIDVIFQAKISANQISFYGGKNEKENPCDIITGPINLKPFGYSCTGQRQPDPRSTFAGNMGRYQGFAKPNRQ